MTTDLVLIGGGGHCRSCIDVVTMTGTFSITGILDLPEKKGNFLDSCPYIGTDEDIARLAGEGHQFLVTLGQIKTSRARYELFLKVLENEGNLPKIISPLAYVSSRAEVDRGSIVMHRAILNAGTRVGENVIVNTGAIIEHDAGIGSHCHIATGAIVNGGARIGSHCFIGSGTVIKQGVAIGDHSVIGAGVTLLKDVSGGQVVK